MSIQHKSIPIEDEGQAGEVQLVLDPNDPEDVGGYVYGDDVNGEGGEWHTNTCPCELCRVERRELLERVAAATPPLPECEGADCQGCGRIGVCPELAWPTANEVLKERDEWRIAQLHSARPDMDEAFWRERVESGCFNWPEPEPPLPYPGFSQYVLTVEQKGEALPALLKRSDGATILYAGKVNSVFGEPGMGKSWIALEAALASLKNGGRVLWWDFEDKPDTLYRRAKALGQLDLITGENVAFIKDNNILELEDDLPNMSLLCAVEWLADAGIYSLVIIDAAESSGAPSDGSSVTEWIKEKVSPFQSRGVGVLILDHVPKRRQERPRGAIGSQYKLAKIDGAAIGVSGKPWTKTQDGAMVLRLEKDRQGDVPGNVGAKIATIKGHYEGELLTISIDPPNQEDGEELDIPMLLLEAIGAAGAEGVRGQNVLMGKVTGKGKHKQEALIMLIQDGLVVQTKDGKAQVHTLTDAGRVLLEEGGE